VLAYGASGGTRWVRTYDGSAHGVDAATAVASGPARVYVTGTSDGGPTGTDYVTVAYTSGGKRLWARRYDSGPNSADAPSAIAVSNDGSTIFVTGTTATIAYRSDGTKLWGAPATPGSHLGVSPDVSKVFVTRVDGNDIVTIGIDAGTGKRRWIARFEVHTPDDPPTVAGIMVSPDGGSVYVGAMIIHEMGERAPGVLAYTTDGAPLWESDLLTQVYGPATSLAVSEQGDRVYVTGDYCVAAFDTAGHQIWLHVLDPTSDHVAALAPTPSGGRILAAGRAGDGSSSDYLALALSRGGESRWSAGYDGTGHGLDEAVGIVVSRDGSTVFVTGTSEGLGTGLDIVTIAYGTS
jgi:hypothetical protein